MVATNRRIDRPRFKPAWYDLTSQTRRGVRCGAILGALAPSAALVTGSPTTAALALLVVPITAVIGGWALTDH